MATQPSAVTVSVEEIPVAPTPARENITPGRRVRLVNISPVCLNGLTGITQANPASRPAWTLSSTRAPYGPAPGTSGVRGRARSRARVAPRAASGATVAVLRG
ncbi:hypothetical protein ACIRU3_32840 [Streptomyces sp. NPDC101151]|uniref:hypothetical protein n=1 Tax=Streptomyces sp. NPDC101151 TaxID=3366115 RepID=UPI0037F6D5CC